MSSTYRPLCLSHDPALVLDDEWQSGNDGRVEMADILNLGKEYPLEGHETCELVGGRFSYPLIEVYCPAGCRWHGSGEWVRVEWLRLARAAHLNTTGRTVGLTKALGDLRCWTPERLHRLRHHLDPS